MPLSQNLIYNGVILSPKLVIHPVRELADHIVMATGWLLGFKFVCAADP